jgi:Uma2 family endonuclease
MAVRQPKPPKNEFPVSKYHGRRMTEAEFLALPEEKPYLEYVDGVVIQKPMPNRDHRRIVEELIFQIGTYRRLHQLRGSAGPEGRVRLPDGSGFRLPDTAYWAPGRLDGDDSVPSLVVEARSPGQALAELRRKCRAFRANGVDVCWLIDPLSRTAEVFEGDRDGEALPSDGVLETAVMPGFSLSLVELFAVLDR